MPGIALQGSPRWVDEYARELVNKSRALSKERYQPYALSPQRKEEIQGELSRLKGIAEHKNKYNIPFSITGRSDPIPMNPVELDHISSNPIFARRIYEEATGNNNPSTEEISDLVNRAKTRINYEKSKSPELSNYINSFPKVKEDIRNLEKQGNEIDKRISRLPFGSFEERRKLKEKKNKITDELNSLSRDYVTMPALEKVAAPRKIGKLTEEGSSIAPMNEMHERATSMLERSFNDDTMKLAGDELREANKQSAYRTVEPLIKSSIEGPSDAYMNKYVNDYTQDIRRALQDESEEQYIKDIAPKINMSFAQMGAFNSGARAKALKDSLLEHRQKLHRELAHLTGHARDRAMEHHELQKRREQSAAGLAEGAIRAEKEGSRQQAELLRHQAVTRQGLSHMNAAALGQIARAQQEQEQHQIDAARQEQARQELYPHEQLARESALMHGLPVPSSQTLTSTLQPAPPPPNLFTLGAGALGSLAAGFNNPQQQQRQFKKGGSVRRNYAEGGHIGNDIRNLINEHRHADKSHLEQASHHNPIQSWLRHVGSEMLSNPQEDPLLSLGRGTAASLNHADVVKERAANLYDKIQATRLNQYKVLAEYENMQQKNALEREDLLERKNYHQKKHDLRRSMLEGAQTPFSLIQEKTPKSLSSSERKIEVDAKKDLLRAIRMKKEVDHLTELVGKTSTGPIIGGIKGVLPKTKIDNQIEVGTNKLILDMHQGMKNIPRSEEFLKRIESTKPNRSNYPEANMEAIKLMHQGANDVEEHSISTLLSMGWSPQKIEKQFKVKVPKHFLEESESENPGEMEESHGNSVKMIDPEGNPLEVPESDVEEALKAGASYAP